MDLKQLMTFIDHAQPHVHRGQPQRAAPPPAHHQHRPAGTKIARRAQEGRLTLR